MWNRWRSTRHRYFNPRPREGGRRPLVLREISIDEFQSTPPRGGATAMEDNKPADTWISIHAPARGGDAAYQLKIDALEISIHAPARGGDTSAADRSFTSRNFNPRPREGGRPPWRSSGPSRAHNFNPRPREGGDSKDAQFYLRIFDKQVELLRFWGKMRGGCLRNPEKDRRFLGKSLANLPEISGHLDFAGA